MKENNSRQKVAENITPKCTACSCVIDFNNSNEVMQHPLLKVLLCSLCHKKFIENYTDKNATKLCIWCVEPGDYSCNNCGRFICIECIERNFGQREVIAIGNKNWNCYVCEPKSLEALVAFCERMVLLAKNYDDSEDDEAVQKEIKKMCWLEQLIENYRLQLEESCEQLYHWKFKLRRKRALFENQAGVDNEYISLLSPLSHEIFENTRKFSESLNDSKMRLAAKSRFNQPQPNTNLQKPQPIHHVQEIAPKPNLPSNSQAKIITKPRIVEARKVQIPVIKATNINQARMKRSAPPATYSTVSPNTHKRLSNIVKGQNVVVSFPMAAKRRIVSNENSQVYIKQEPESPPHEQELELHSPSPPPPPVPKPPNIKFSRGGKQTRNIVHDNRNPFKPAPQPIPMNIQIKEEPIDEIVDESEMSANHNYQGPMPQESQDECSDSQQVEAEERETSQKSSNMLIEELKNRKELSIQTTNLVTVKDVHLFGYNPSNTNFTVSRTTVKEEQVVTNYSKPTNTPGVATVKITEQQQQPQQPPQPGNRSGIINLLKGSEPMMVMMSEGEESDENEYSTTVKEGVVNPNNANKKGRGYNDDSHSFHSTSSQSSMPENFFGCSQCCTNFSTEEELMIHISKVHEERKGKAPTKSFVCVFCDKPFRTKNTYEKHMKMHNRLSGDQGGIETSQARPTTKRASK